MKNRLPIFFFVLAISYANSQSFNPALAAKLQFTLDSLTTMFTNTKGMSASVYCPGQGIWKGASGLSYTGQPITTDMVFGLASNSKLFTAVTLLKLAEDNVLSLNDALHEWIPAYPNINSNITIRQLLNHTSGVSDPFFSTSLLDSVNAHPTHVYTPEEVLTWVGPPLFAPGASTGYSNINYILAGLVAESATGVPISELIRNSILTPLQMDSTFFDIQEPATGNIAHRWEDGIDFHDTSRISLNTSVGPAGSLFSTSGEMAQWYHALMSGQVLNAGSFAEMTTFAPPGNLGLGLGLFTFFGNTCWGHGGSTIGYKNRMIYDPCMQAVVCGLSNSNPTAVDGITALLYKVLVDNLPACSGAISGISTVCQGQNNVTYMVPLIANASTYTWTLPAGATGTSNTNSITVNYSGSAVSGLITVRGNNIYGDGAASSMNITVQPTPNPVISGLSDSCQDGIQTYSVVPGVAGTTYAWIVTNGTVVSGCGLSDSSCTVQWGAIGNGGISVVQTNP